MSTNHYTLHGEDTVDARDVAALLEELKDVGGVVTDASGPGSGRPLSGTTVRRGMVGSTNVLSEQQLSISTGATAPGLSPHRRGSAGHGTGLPQRPSAAGAGNTAVPTGFSSYSAADAAMATALLAPPTSNSVTPLGVRLTPLNRHVTASALAPAESGVLTPLPPPSPAHTAPDSERRWASLTAQTALPPLPSSGTRRPSGASDSPATKSSAAEGSWNDPGTGGEKGGAGAVRAVNFLPIMCARHLRPVGLTPSARWGHTLTTVTADMLLLFGGVDLQGTEMSSLMSFNPVTISWEPLYAASEGPGPRHSHAACAYDGRYLIISGGMNQMGGKLFDDIHLYDTYTHQWRCVWAGEREGSAQNRNEPGPRSGHSIVLYEDRLYLYGGKTVATADGQRKKANHNATAAACLDTGADVFVFSLNSYRWRRRVRLVKDRRSASSLAATAVSETPLTGITAEVELPTRPGPRSHHAACVRGSTFFIHGGAGQEGVLTDTWSLELTTGAWRCVHRGGTADAVPREKHALFACGEALLLVGGCSGGGTLNERITCKFTNFAVVLPVVGAVTEAPCWIPVAMGNVAIVAPARRSFGAALCNGFVYVFGGVCATEPATSTMLRFLATDGCVSEDDPGTSGGEHGAQQLRLMLQQLRDQQRGTPYDVYAYAGTYGSVADVSAVVAQQPPAWAGHEGGGGASGEESHANAARRSSASVSVPTADPSLAGLHRVLIHQRAPLFLAELEKCRSDLYHVGSSNRGGGLGGSSPSLPSVDGVSPQKQRGSTSVDEDTGDEVDALLRHVADGGRAHASTLTTGGGGGAAAPQAGTDFRGGAKGMHNSGDAQSGVPFFYTNGTTRISGLSTPLSAEELQCLVDYIYWGGLKGKYRALLEEEREAEEGAEETQASGCASGSFSAEYRSQLVHTLETVKTAAGVYQLLPLAELCAGLLAGSRGKMRTARQHSSNQLRADLASLLDSGTGANTTMLVVDPHTTAQSAHVLHASVLMAASGLFTELLRPLYRASAGFGGSKAANQVGPLAAKLSASVAQSGTALLTSTSRRTVLIGPVPLPLPAVRPILRYLYTQELQASGETAFEVMLGAYQLGLTELQALCEAVVAREEVNYQTCCTFYYLARKYRAAFLEEIALLTAVSGYAEVRFSPAYQSLSVEEKQSIDAVATELGSCTWVPPSTSSQEMKSKSTYATRWAASAAP